MKKHLGFFLLFALATLAGGPLAAQDGDGYDTQDSLRLSQSRFRFKAGVHFNSFVPTGTWANDIIEPIAGGGLQVMFVPKHFPLSFGLELDNVQFNGEAVSQNTNIGGFPRSFNLEAYSGMNSGRALLRFTVPTRTIVEPFVDGMAGMTQWYSSVRLRDNDANSFGVLERYRIQNDWAMQYGAAIGAQSYFGKSLSFGMEVRAGYLWGGEIDYLGRDFENTPTAPNSPLDFYSLRSADANGYFVEVGAFMVF